MQALRNEELTIYGEGQQTRSFCYVDDLVSGIIKLMDSDFSKPINIGNPKEFTILDLADLINSKFNWDYLHIKTLKILKKFQILKQLVSYY